jgi:voltage-gated potassium channel Kch
MISLRSRLLGWDAIVVVVATLAALVAPAAVVVGTPSGAVFVAIEWAITIVFVIDGVVRARRARYGAGWNWLSRTRAGLVVDVVAAIPFGALFGAGTVWQLLRLVKLLRVGESMHDWRYRAIEHATLLRLVFFLYWLGILTHWIACGWISLQDVPAASGTFTTYLEGLYWTMTTLSTVGYGDITPVTDLQRVYTVGVMVLGLVVYGFIIGNVATLLFSIDPARTLHRQRMEQLSSFMSQHDIPPELRERTIEYYRYRWRNRLDHDESEVLGWLSPPLQAEIAAHVNRDLMKSVPMFRDAGEAFLRDVTLELQLEVLMPGDLAVRAGDRARSMYFVSQGELEVVSTATGERLRTLGAGDFFGEIGLVFDEVRTASVRALGFCHLYRLDRDLFQRILEDYPEVAAQIRRQAEEWRDTT